MVESGTDVVVADAQATFHASPRFDDLLDLEMTIEKLGNTLDGQRASRRSATASCWSRAGWFTCSSRRATNAKQQIRTTYASA